MSGFPQYLLNFEKYPFRNVPILFSFLFRRKKKKEPVPEEKRKTTATAWGFEFASQICCKSSNGVNSRQKAAFTLAEVLITLMILGVVALLTIPALIKNVEQHILIGQIKEAYSITQQIVQRATVDYGHPTGWEKTYHKSADFAEKYVLPYIHKSHICGLATYADKLYNHNCFIKDDLNGHWKYLNGNENYGDRGGYASGVYYNIKLSNGMDLGVWTPSSQAAGETAIFVFDVNGSAGPSIAGKDIFYFSLDLYTGKIIAGATYQRNVNSILSMSNLITGDSVYACNKNNNASYAGMLCGRVLEKNGWKFPADYPW